MRRFLMKKLSMLGFVSLALFLGLSLVAYPNSAAAADGGVILGGDEAAAALGADADLDAQGVNDIRIYNGADNRLINYIPRGQSFNVWSYYSNPYLSCYPCKIKNKAIIKYNNAIQSIHLTTKKISGYNNVSGSGAALSCESYAAYGQRVKVQVIVVGGPRRTEYFYVYN
jgi:hypothetical protein